MNAEVIALIGVIIAALVGYFSSRLSMNAQIRKADNDKQVQLEANRVADNTAKATSDNNSGKLALEIANRLDAEVKDLRHWKALVIDWWNEHQRWDRNVIQVLEDIDSEIHDKIGDPPRMPDEI